MPKKKAEKAKSIRKSTTYSVRSDFGSKKKPADKKKK